MFVKPIKSANKEIKVAGDKSITHRAIIFNGIADGDSTITDPLLGEDCLSTVDCMQRLGTDIRLSDGKIFITGTRRYNTDAKLYVGNSGTAIRLLTGLISGLNIKAELTGDESILRRPIQRVVNPLEQMGAQITVNKGFAPVRIMPARLTGIRYHMPVASAQVKSAVLLAGLNASGVTEVIESVKSRNHTELMLKAMGADIEIIGGTIRIKKSKLKSADITVPADISSAAYFIVLATVLKNSRIVIPNVGVNPSRTGIIDLINGIGGKISLANKRTVCGELVADVIAESAELRPFTVDGDIVPRLIDEIPVLAVLAAFIDGQSVMSGSQELRLKETDRIATTVESLQKMGADIEPKQDGMIIRGTGKLRGGNIDAEGDHRIAMSMAIAGLLSDNGAHIEGHACADVSFPRFFDILSGLRDGF